MVQRDEDFVISYVEPDSKASKAGMQIDDVIDTYHHFDGYLQNLEKPINKKAVLEQFCLRKRFTLSLFRLKCKVKSSIGLLAAYDDDSDESEGEVAPSPASNHNA